MRTNNCLIYINRLDHYGEPAVPLGKIRVTDDGVEEVLVWLVYCIHGGGQALWVERDTIRFNGNQ